MEQGAGPSHPVVINGQSIADFGSTPHPPLYQLFVVFVVGFVGWAGFPSG